MPTRASQKNPYRQGDVVILPPKGNGSYEGVLWRVTKVKDGWVIIEPLLTLTGPSVLNRKRMWYSDVHVPNVTELAYVRNRLDDIILDLCTRYGSTVGSAHDE